MNFENENQEIKVSVYCLAYNHEKYIRKTLEGFVNQKTSFKYEVWVHDDASTDNTRVVIDEFAKKYPEIIHPIYQIENQYSKGVKIMGTHILPKMRGKYIACCEGDDYWCDVNKLQIQADYLDRHLDYVACVHNTIYWEIKNDEKKLFNQSLDAYDLQIDHVVIGGGADYHTSSLMYRVECAREIYSAQRPEFFDKAKGFGDYPLSIFLVSKGKVRYLPNIMSVYRYGVVGSWSCSMAKAINILKREYSLADMLVSVDEYLKFEVHSTIQPLLDRHYLKILNLETGLGTLRSKDMMRIYRKQNIIRKFKIIFKLLFVNKLLYYR